MTSKVFENNRIPIHPHFFFCLKNLGTVDGHSLRVRDAKPSCPCGVGCVGAWRCVIQWGLGSRGVLAGCWHAYLWGIPFSKDLFMRTYLFVSSLGIQLRRGICNLNNYPGLPPPCSRNSCMYKYFLSTWQGSICSPLLPALRTYPSNPSLFPSTFTVRKLGRIF